MNEWVYPVNEQSQQWEGPPLLEYLRTTATDHWYVATGFRKMAPGDRIWVYGTTPHRRIVGVGLVATGPDRTSPMAASRTTSTLRGTSTRTRS